MFEQTQIAKLEELANDPSEFWKKWKYFGDSFNNTPQKVDGKKWETYFRRLYQNNNTNTVLPDMNSAERDINNDLNVPFTQEELDHVIDKVLKYGKAAGLDRIKAEFLKATPGRIREILFQLINTVFTANIVPKGWCVGILNLIHKEGSKDNPDNYRGICISSALSKTMSTMMNVRLTKYVTERNMVHKG